MAPPTLRAQRRENTENDLSFESSNIDVFFGMDGRFGARKSDVRCLVSLLIVIVKKMVDSVLYVYIYKYIVYVHGLC